MRDRTPITISGETPLKGKSSLLRLVVAVVTSKRVIRRSRRFVVRRPYITTRPEAIPRSAMSACINVKLEIFIPRSIVSPPTWSRHCTLASQYQRKDYASKGCRRPAARLQIELPREDDGSRRRIDYESRAGCATGPHPFVPMVDRCDCFIGAHRVGLSWTHLSLQDCGQQLRLRMGNGADRRVA